MTLNLGRVTLTTPLSVPYRRAANMDAGLAGPFFTDSYSLRGRENGVSAQTTMDALEKEGRRFGDVYVTSTTTAVPAGYYRVEDVAYEKPGGAPRRRPWSLSLTRMRRPTILREAEDDRVSPSTLLANAAYSNGQAAVIAQTTTEQTYINPRSVSGAEAFNLPEGEWKVLARVQLATTPPVDPRLRCRFTKLDGTLIAETPLVQVTDVGWTVLQLGTLQISSVDAGANWYTIRGATISGSATVRLDWVMFVQTVTVV